MKKYWTWGLIAVVGLVLYLLSRHRSVLAMVGPLQPVGATGNTTPPGALGDPNPAATTLPVGYETPSATALAQLCQAAPLNSFGSACEGITWVRDTNAQPVDLRARPVPIVDSIPLLTTGLLDGPFIRLG